MRKVFIISGPSGSGKTSILKKLFKRKSVRKNFRRIPTVTTRPPRRGEKVARAYHFVSKQEFINLKKKRYFLESKTYLDNFYGTPAVSLKEQGRSKKCPLLCIDVEGALKLKKKFKRKTVLVFIRPPTLGALGARLKKRKTESVRLLKKRLRIAQKEVKYAGKYNYVLVNKDLAKTVNRLEQIMLEEANPRRQKEWARA